MGQIVSIIKSRNEDCARRRPEGGCQVARPHPGAARPWPAPGWRLGPPGAPDSVSSPIYSSFWINPRDTRENPRKVPQPPSSPKQDSGDRSLCSGTLPGRGSSPGAISIDSTTIFIAIVVSPDEEGVVLPRV